MSAPWVLVLTVGLPALGGLFRVWVHQDAVRLGYELTAQERERSELAEELRKLEVELEAERMPGRLKRLAAQRGLSAPSPSQILSPTAGRRASATFGMARLGEERHARP